MRVRRSDWSFSTFTNPRRSSGFKAAVKVVRSIASRDATGPIDGGSGRFRDIKRELPVCQPEWTQYVIKSPRQCSRRALHVKTEAAIPHKERGFVEKRLGS